MEFFRQEYWSGQPFPSPGALPKPSIEPESPALQADSLPCKPPGKLSVFSRCLLLDHIQFTLIHGLNFPGSYTIWSISNYPPLFPSSIVDTYWPGWQGVVYLPVSYLFGLLYSSWHSHSKYPGVVCRSLLQWITFCQNSLLWPIHLGWPCTAWLIASLSYSSPFATKVVSHEGDT